MAKQPTQKNIDRQKAEAARIAAARKKIIMATFLFLTMIVLWLRLFMQKSGPKKVSAVSDINITTTTGGSTESKIVYIDLPVDPCRHNMLAADIFSARDFKGFRRQGEQDFVSGSEIYTENQPLADELESVAQRLELIAIVNDKQRQAFIGDNLVEKGQTLRVIYQGRVYEFKVMNIAEDKVDLECNGVIITKKIPDVRTEE